MFGHRSDGKVLKNVDPVFKIIPNIMMERCDAQVYFSQDIPLNNIDEYITKKQAEGIKYSYMDVIIAAINRTIGERPYLNRFAVNGVLYARNDISVSLVIKKELSDEGEESNLKFHLNGTETMKELYDVVRPEIEKNKQVSEQNNTDKFVNILSKLSYGTVRRVIKFLKFLDKHGCLPKALIDLSPFHTSCFVTNVGSLGINSIYHHLYNFGTTSFFFAIGKKNSRMVKIGNEYKEEKYITLSFVGDERICDGYYYASSFRYMLKLLRKPELLDIKGTKKEDIGL